MTEFSQSLILGLINSAAAATEGRIRYQLVTRLLRGAIELFEQMDEAGIVLDQDNDGSHLPSWLTAANDFAYDQGWR